jgi:hypothetical protein
MVFVFERKGGVEEVTKFLRLMGAASSTVHRCVTQDMKHNRDFQLLGLTSPSPPNVYEGSSEAH